MYINTFLKLEGYDLDRLGRHVRLAPTHPPTIQYMYLVVYSSHPSTNYTTNIFIQQFIVPIHPPTIQQMYLFSSLQFPSIHQLYNKYIYLVVVIDNQKMPNCPVLILFQQMQWCTMPYTEVPCHIPGVPCRMPEYHVI